MDWGAVSAIAGLLAAIFIGLPLSILRFKSGQAHTPRTRRIITLRHPRSRRWQASSVVIESLRGSFG